MRRAFAVNLRTQASAAELPRRPVWWRALWLSAGLVALLLGAVGIFLPLLPTTPFVLLAAWAAANGSEKLHAWLLAHRQFGPMIRDWQDGGAVSRRAKWLASIMMSASAILMLLLMPDRWMAAPGIVVMAVVAAWLWHRPEPH